MAPRLHDEVAGPQRAYESIRTRLAQSQCVAGHAGAMQTIAPRLTLFRFPYGACNERALREVHDQGLMTIQWDVSTGDPNPQQPAAAIVAAMLAPNRGRSSSTTPTGAAGILPRRFPWQSPGCASSDMSLSPCRS